MEQRELLEAYSKAKSEFVKQQKARNEADEAMKSARKYISNVKTEVHNIKQELKKQDKELAEKCKSECEEIKQKILTLAPEQKKEKQALTKQAIALKAEFKAKRAEVAQLLELTK